MEVEACSGSIIDILVSISALMDSVGILIETISMSLSLGCLMIDILLFMFLLSQHWVEPPDDLHQYISTIKPI